MLDALASVTWNLLISSLIPKLFMLGPGNEKLCRMPIGFMRLHKTLLTPTSYCLFKHTIIRPLWLLISAGKTAHHLAKECAERIDLDQTFIFLKVFSAPIHLIPIKFYLAAVEKIWFPPQLNLNISRLGMRHNPLCSSTGVGKSSVAVCLSMALAELSAKAGQIQCLNLFD